MRSYDRLLKRYGEFAKIALALKTIRPGKLYKITFVESGEWVMGIIHRCTYSAVKFHTVASSRGFLPYPTKGFAITLYKLTIYKIEQMRMADLPAYISAYTTERYEKILKGEIKILED